MKKIILIVSLLVYSLAFSQDYQTEYKEMFQEDLQGELIMLTVDDFIVEEKILVNFKKTGVQFVKETNIGTPARTFYYPYSQIVEIRGIYQINNGRLTNLSIMTSNMDRSSKN